MKNKFIKIISIVLLIFIVTTGVFADDGEMFRKNVSKTPSWETEHAALRMLPVYVPVQTSDGYLPDNIEFEILDVEADGSATSVETLQLGYVRPLIAFYTDGHVDYIDDPLYGGFPGHGERDAYAAVSLDDGASWQRTNLSNSADLSSFKIKLGGRQKVPYPGDVGRSFLASDGNQVLAVWVSRFAGGGSPNYAMTDEERLAVAEYMGLDVTACTDGDLIATPCLYLEDHFGVAGSQGSSDLADEGLPLVGELPYAALWAARGVILPPEATGLESSTIVWFKAERLSSAVRDANRPEAACAKGAGCVITWQEDPGGIRPGEGEGPGEGWSGAIAHHQTDTWYSYISWDDFSLVSEDGNYGNLYSGTGDLAAWVAENATGRPQAAVPISIPVRLTDNSMCTDDGTQSDDPFCYMDFDGSGIADFCASTIAATIETPEGPIQDVQMCVTEDGRLMRGNTASTRARVGLHEYSSTAQYVFGAEDNTAFFESIDSAWFSMSYEENKGLGECDDIDETKLDMGKNVWYHTFDMFNPEVVSQGLMLNQPAVYPDDFTDPLGTLTQDTSLGGYNFYQITEDPIYETLAGLESTLYQTEISRRPSPITQDWYLVGETGTVGFQLWKQGIIRRGGPADIMGRRFTIDFETFVSTTDNPYDYANLVCDTWAFTDGSNPRYVKGLCADPAVNLSANTIINGEDCADMLSCQDAFPFNDYFDDLEGGLPISKIYEWQWYGPGYGETITDTTLTNFDDTSWENPYDVAKGHRGFLNGDMLMVMYAWSPNWMANTVGHDNYNLYNRRSFDGGLTWSTTPSSYGGDGATTCEWMGPAGSDTEYPVCTTYAAGEFEQARNVSQLVGTRETILDPRYTPAPPPITDVSVTTLLPPGFSAGEIIEDDIRNPSVYFMVYETGDNTTVAVGEAEPLDLFYSRAINWGDDYQVWADENELSECWPSADAEAHVDIQGTGFCNEFDALEGSQFSESGEASVTTNPSGRFFYSLWNQVDFGVDGLSEDSDAWFRRVLYWFSPEYIMPTYTFPDSPSPPPVVDEAPVISIISPVEYQFTEGDVINFSGSADDVEDGDLSSVLIWISDLDREIGVGATFNTSALTVGLHTITVSVTDSYGHVVTETLLITIDPVLPPPVDEEPVISIISPVEDQFTEGDVINFSGSADDVEDGDLSSVLVWTSDLDGEIDVGASFDYSELTVGLHTITVSVTDSYGHVVTETLLITIDPVLPPPVDEEPVISIISPVEDQFTEGDVINFSGSAIDVEDGDLSSVLIWISDLDGEIGVGATFDALALTVGLHTITVSVTDSYGHVVTETLLITIDPVIILPQMIVLPTVNSEVVTKGDVLEVTVTVTDENDIPIADAAVMVTIEFAKIDVILTATTNVDGISVVSYKVNSNKTGIGTANVIATVTKVGYDPGAAKVTLEVQ